MALDSLEKTLDTLIQEAEPGSNKHIRLSKLRNAVDRKVMLSMSDRNFIRQIYEKRFLSDCERIDIHGNCTKLPIGQCTAAVGWQDGEKGCTMYSPSRANSKASFNGLFGG